MVNIREIIVVNTHVLQVGDAVGLATRTAGGHLVLVTEDDDEGRSIFGIFALDEAADSRGGSANLVGVVHIQIEALHSLPCNPILHALFEHTVGDDEHLHRSLPKVRMLLVHIVTPVEHGLVNSGEIGAERTGKFVVGSGFVVVVVTHFNLDVVEYTYAVSGGVVLHRIDGQRTDLDAAHGAFDLHSGDGTFVERLGSVCFLVVNELYVLGLLVLAN